MSALPTTRPDARARPAVSKSLLALLSVLAVIGPISMELYLPTLPDVADTLGLSSTQAAWSLLGCLSGLAIGQVLWGPVSDRFGRRPVALVALVVWTAVTLGCALAASAGWFVVLRLGQGLAGAAGLTVSRAVLADLLPADALTRPLARLMILTSGFTILSPVIGGALLTLTDWRGIFWILVAVGVVVTTAVALRLPETGTGGRGGERTSLVALLRNRSFALATLTSGLAFATIMVYVTFAPEVLRGDFGLSGLQFGVVFASTAVAMVAGAQSAPRLAERLSPPRLVGAALAAAIIATAALAAVGLVNGGNPPLVVCLPFFFVSNAAVGVVMPLGAAAAMAGLTGGIGTASGLIGGIQFGLGALVGLVVAPVFPGGVTAIAAAMAVTATVSLTVWRRLARLSDM